jgi:hypothetical protein
MRSCLQKARLIGLQRERTGRQAPEHPVTTSHRPQARSTAPHLVHLAACRCACSFHKLRLFSSTLPRRAPASAGGAAGTSPPRVNLAYTLGELSGLSLLAVCAVVGRLQLSKASCARTFLENSSPAAAAGRGGLPAAYLELHTGPWRPMQ